MRKNYTRWNEVDSSSPILFPQDEPSGNRKESDRRTPYRTPDTQAVRRNAYDPQRGGTHDPQRGGTHDLQRGTYDRERRSTVPHGSTERERPIAATRSEQIKGRMARPSRTDHAGYPEHSGYPEQRSGQINRGAQRPLSQDSLSRPERTVHTSPTRSLGAELRARSERPAERFGQSGPLERSTRSDREPRTALGSNRQERFPQSERAPYQAKYPSKHKAAPGQASHQNAYQSDYPDKSSRPQNRSHIKRTSQSESAYGTTQSSNYSDVSAIIELLEAGLPAVIDTFPKIIPELRETSTLISQLARYISDLIQWNRVHRLSGIRDAAGIIEKHIIDSLSLVPEMASHSQRFLDLGTGAGLPGIPLALARPDCHFTLMDSCGKKTRFLKQICHALQLSNVTVEQTRVEYYVAAPLFDGIITRAFSTLSSMLQLSQHCCKPDGQFWAMKGCYPVAELEVIPAGFTILEVKSLQVPGLQAERHLVRMAQSKS